MDNINDLPTDNEPVSNEHQTLLNKLFPKAGAAVGEPIHKFDEVYNEIKISIFAGVIAIIIFSPLVDKLLCELGIKSVSSILFKIVLFVIIHYFLIRKFIRN